MPGQRIFNDLARSLSIITCILFQWEDWSAYYYSLLEFYKPIIHCMVFYIVVLAGGENNTPNYFKHSKCISQISKLTWQVNYQEGVNSEKTGIDTSRM